jgi:hypothetical protein
LQDSAEPALKLPDAAQLFVDVGYNFYEWEDYWRKINRMKLQIPRKIKSQRAREPGLRRRE